MEQTRELRRALLRERIRLTRLMMEAGYYPYSLSWNAAGAVQMTTCPNCSYKDKALREKLLAKLELELAELEAGSEKPEEE